MAQRLLKLDLSLDELPLIHELQGLHADDNATVVRLYLNNNAAPSHFGSQSKRFSTILRILRHLPSLREVTVDFGYQQFPVSAITALLKGRDKFQSLTFHQLFFEGTPEDFNALGRVLSKQHKLTKLVFSHCIGSEVVQQFLTRIPAITELTLISTSISAFGATTERILQHLCSSDQLESLILRDVPGMNERAGAGVAKALANVTKIHTLEITSQNLGEETGIAIIETMQSNQVVRHLTLRLGGNWDSSSTYVSKMLTMNTTLQSLHFLIYDGAEERVTSKSIEIVEALANPFLNITDLCLSLEVDPLNKVPAERQRADPRVYSALEAMFNKNINLTQLTLTDDGMLPLEIPQSIHQKVVWNRTGIPKFQQKYCQPGSNMDDNAVMKSIISHSDNLHVVYFVLSKNPALINNSHNHLPASPKKIVTQGISSCSVLPNSSRIYARRHMAYKKVQSLHKKLCKFIPY